MSSMFALFKLAMLFVSTLLIDGSPRYFDVSPKEGNAELIVTLDASLLAESKKANTFLWTFGNGETLTTTHPIINYTYNHPGTFTVNLDYQSVEIDKKGRVKIKHQKDGGSVKIRVHPKPNVAPIASLNCSAPDFLKLTCSPEGSADSDGQIVSYKYEWGDETQSVLNDNSVTIHDYQSAGEKIVRLTVTDDKGATHSVEKTFLIKENTKPTASFTCEKTTYLSINCQSNSTDPDEELSQFSWTLDDGTVYTTKTFSHTFNKRPGDVAVTEHKVSLKVSDSLGLTDVTEKIVSVDLEPILEAPRGYFKAFIDGTHINLRTFIARTQFASKKAYYQIFDSQNNLIKTIPLTEFYANTLNRVNLENYGNYRIVLTMVDYRDQVATTSRQIPLVENTSTLQPFVSFRAVQTNIRTLYLNLNQSFDYDENYSISEFIINFGNGLIKSLKTDTFITYTYPEAGTYNVSVTAKTNHGTERTFSQAVTVTDEEVPAVRPDPTFSYRIYSFAQNVSFYNEKSGTPNGEIISYHWDFGDGTTAEGETQAHFYMPGEYLVSLTIVDTAGFSSTQTQKIRVTNTGDDIVANIDCNLRKEYMDVTQLCQVHALDKFGEVSRVRVVWGDGTVFTLATPFDQRQGLYYPQKKYLGEGTYSIRLIVNTLRGDFKTHDITRTIVARRPIALLNCFEQDRRVECDATASTDPKNTKLTYSFQFSDGHIENNESGKASHLFDSDGEQLVTVTVTDETGLSSSQSFKIFTYARRPIANIQCTVNNLLVFCDALGSYDPKGQPLYYTFDFGNGHVESNSTGIITHAYQVAGLYNVTLKVEDTSSLSALASTQVMPVSPPNQLPIAILNSSSLKPQIISCNAKDSYDPDGFIISAKYELEDGSIYKFSPESIFEHTFNTSGEKTINLTVYDNDGGFSTTSFQVNVLENPAPNLQIECESIEAFKLSCSAQADDDSVVSSIEWYINNELTSISTFSFIHYFLSSGLVEVKAIVTDDLGKTSEKILNVEIKDNQKPVADGFCSSSGVFNLNCFSSSYDPDQIGDLKIEWFINEELIHQGAIFSKDIGRAGLVNVKLVVTDFYGNFDEKIFDVILEDNKAPVARIECSAKSSSTVECGGENSYDLDGNVVDYVWSFEGTLIGGVRVIYTFKSGGQKEIFLTVKDNHGKENTTAIMIDINEIPKAELVCDKLTNFKVKCSASSGVPSYGSSQLYYKIQFDVEAITEGATAEYEFQTLGNKKIILYVSDESGKKTQVEYNVEILPEYTLPRPLFEEEVDLDYLVKFDSSKSKLQGRSVIKYEWNFGDNTQIETTSDTIEHRYLELGNKTVTLKVTDEKGNSTQYSKLVAVYNPEVQDPGEDGKLELKGVDSDNNGIRDDVQRWIQYEANNNLEIKGALMKIAAVYEENFKFKDSQDLIAGNFTKLRKLEQCLKLYYNSEEKIDELKSIFKIAYGNTNERFETLLKIDSSFAGEEIPREMNAAELEMFCGEGN